MQYITLYSNKCKAERQGKSPQPQREIRKMSRRQQIKNKVTHYATEWENGNNRANSTLCSWILKAYDQSNQFGKEMDALRRELAPTRFAAAES